MLKVLPPHLISLDFCDVTTIQESKVDEKLKHIARVVYNSSNECWAMNVVTKKKCTTKIVSNPRAPLHRHTLEFETITNLQHLKLRSFFRLDDIDRCVKGSCREWVDKFSTDQERPPIPPV
jgi:hypothetical protein